MATIKGITIEIAGKTSELVNSLKSADSALANTNSALKAVNKALEFDSSNVELAAQKQALLAEAVEATQARLEALRTAADLAHQGLADGSTSTAQYAQLTAEIATTEASLRDLTVAADEAANEADDLANNMGVTADALQDVATEADDAGDELEDASNKSGGGWEDLASKIYSVKSILETVGQVAAQVGRVVVDFVSDAVNGYAQIEQFEGGLEKLYGEDALTVINNANQAFLTSGMSASEYMQNATSLSAILINSLGDTAEAADVVDVALRAVADNSATFGTDLDSLSGVLVSISRGMYQTLDNLSLGYAGTQEGMLELINDSGIFLDEVESLDEVSFADMVLAIDAVQRKMGIAGTAADEALSTISGSVQATQNAWENLKTGLADPNADIGLLVENMSITAQAALENIGPVLTNIVESFQEMVPLLQESLEDILPFALELITALAEGLIQALPTLAGPMGQIISELVVFLVSNLDLIIDFALELILALVDGLIVAIPELIPACVQMIEQIVTSLIEHGVDLVAAALELVVSIALGLVAGIPDIIAAIVDIGSAMFEACMGQFDAIIEAASTWGADMIQGFIDGITAGFSNLTTAVSNAASIVSDYLHFTVPEKGPLADFDESGADMIDEFSNSMLGELGTLETALNITGNTIKGGMEQSPNYSGVLSTISNGITSLGSQPVVVNVQIGDQTLESFVVGANSNYNFVSGGY